MKISLNWLKSYINYSLQASELAALLTQRGLEVSQLYTTIKGGLEGLVIGKIVSCLPHPNADRLKQTLVDVGAAEPLSIVCGAANVMVGQKVIVAPIGTTIYSYLDQFPCQIKKVKIRGVLSEGMICAENEIGLGPNDDGILVLDTILPPGSAIKDHFKDALDEILEIEITPNRADACSHFGIARELKAILNIPTTLPSVDAFTTSLPLPLKVEVLNPLLTPRYCGLLLKNIAIQRSPEWLRTRLIHIGVKPINNVVDACNFVLHALGQPLHAYDYNAIIGKELRVQQLPSATPFIGLDGVERRLSGHELMVCDRAAPIAMAGILGGLTSCVTDATKHIFLESSYFNPAIIRNAAQYHNLKTDAAFLFERGTDPNMPLYALKTVVLLLQKLIPSAEASEVIDLYPNKLVHFTIPISYAKIMQCLGITIAPTVIKQIVTDLEIAIEAETDQGFIAKVPPYRVDVTREVDLIEEIIRIYGYDTIPITGRLATTYLAAENSINNSYTIEQEICKMLVANNYYEIWTNSLTKRVDATIWPENATKIVSILNPFSGSADVLRATLLFSGLETIVYNLTHRQYDLKFFEFGTVYSKDNATYKEEKRLAIWLTGKIEPDNWMRQLGPVTLQTLRTTIEQLTQKLGIVAPSYAPVINPFYEQAVQVAHQAIALLTFGQIRSSITDYFAIEQPVFFADIHWKNLLTVGKQHQLYTPITTFPTVKRALSLVVDKDILFQKIEDLVIAKVHKNLQEIRLVDVYEGAHLPADKKSYTISLILQDKEKTLDDKTISQIMNQLIQIFEHDLNAIIRR